MNTAVQLVNGLVVEPLKGVISFLTAGDGRHDADDIYAKMENGGQAPQNQHLRQQNQAFQPIDIHDVIKRCYESAKHACNYQTGELGEGDDEVPLLPVEDSFLFNTYVTDTQCELGCPHRVRWINRTHPLVLFMHYGNGSRLKTPVAATAATPFGTIYVYSELVVRERLGWLIKCCEKLDMPVAVYKRPPAHQAFPAGQEPVSRIDAAAAADDDDEYHQLRLSPAAMASQQPDEWQMYCKRYYAEVMQTMDPRHADVRYVDLFYMLMYTQYQAPQLSMPTRLVWMSATHPLLGIAKLNTAHPVRTQYTKYGVFRIYAEHQVQAAMDELTKHLCQNDYNIVMPARPARTNGVHIPRPQPIIGFRDEEGPQQQREEVVDMNGHVTLELGSMEV